MICYGDISFVQLSDVPPMFSFVSFYSPICSQLFIVFNSFFMRWVGCCPVFLLAKQTFCENCHSYLLICLPLTVFRENEAILSFLWLINRFNRFLWTLSFWKFCENCHPLSNNFSAVTVFEQKIQYGDFSFVRYSDHPHLQRSTQHLKMTYTRHLKTPIFEWNIGLPLVWTSL